MEFPINPEKFRMMLLSTLEAYQKPQQNLPRSITIGNGMKYSTRLSRITQDNQQFRNNFQQTAKIRELGAIL